MKVGAGLDLSDPTLSEEIGGFSREEEDQEDFTEGDLEEPEVCNRPCHCQ